MRIVSHTSYHSDTKKEKSKINKTVLFTWITVMMLTVFFWSGVAFIYKQDYVPHAVAKLQQKQEKFLDKHKALQKKLRVIYSSFS